MKKILILTLFTLLSGWVMAQTAATTESEWLVNKGQVTPDFTFTWKGGKQDEIKNHRGKVVMINFFATWCPPCRAELPRVQKEIWDKYKDRADFNLLVLGREENWDVLDPFIEKMAYTFPILPDLERKIFSKFATQSIPRNVILDREGKIIYQSIGYEEAEFEQMLVLLEKELNKEQP
jgi:thiol-disulfide isomerase/thioredoxin